MTTDTLRFKGELYMATPTRIIRFPFRLDKNGQKHYFGQIYKPTRYRAKLWRINPMCQICRTIIEDYEDATLDHIVPRALGGHTVFHNIQLAHTECNYKKADKMPKGLIVG